MTMNSYNKVKNNIFIEDLEIVKMAVEDLDDLDDFVEKGGLFYTKRLNRCKDAIGLCMNEFANLDECAVIEIGNCTNTIIDVMKNIYEFFPDEYVEDFEGAIKRHVFGKGNSKHNIVIHYGKHECDTLGIDVDDLALFKGKNPLDDEVGDSFRRIVNENYGVNIPMAGVVDDAFDYYTSIKDSGDDMEILRAYVMLRELQRDAGLLKNGNDGMFNLLEDDEFYQNAKNAIKGKCR